MKAPLSTSCIEPLESRLAPAFAATFDVANLDGHNGFKITGLLSDYATVNDAGDVNGDGFADVIVGDPSAGAHNSNFGASYVVFGKAGGFKIDLDLSKLNGSDGFKIRGDVKRSYFGHSVSSAGDVNGDGFDDLLIGAPGSDEYSAPYSYRPAVPGAAYVIFGKAAPFPASFKLSTLDGSNGFKLADNEYQYDSRSTVGFDVSGAGDVNGDGFDDVIVGVYQGGLYVVFGKSAGFGAEFDLASLDGHNGFKSYGDAMGDGGDINGDGFDDLVFGVPYALGSGIFTGACYVVFGRASGFTAQVDLGILDGTNGFQLSGIQKYGQFGESVSGAGDVNGDGFSDLIIGAPGDIADSSFGSASYVVFGRARGFAANLDVSALDGGNGFVLKNSSYRTGYSVSGAGDVNGDGFDDLLLDAWGIDSYVVYGKAGDFSAQFDLSTVNGLNGFKIHLAPANDNINPAGSSAGDINGDGFADLVFASGACVVFGSEQTSFSPNGKTVQLVDGDGDLLAVTTNKGHFHPSDFSFAPDGGLASIDLREHASEFAGANITIHAKALPGGQGDGMLDLGQLLADGVDLGSIKIDGHLGLFRAGDAEIRTPGVKTLAVKGLGGPGGLHSAITGALGALVVRGDVLGADVSVLGGTKAGVGRLEVSGSIGEVSAFHIGGNLGSAHIGRDLGGGGIHVGGRIGSLTVDGNVRGDDPLNPLIISALGRLGAATASDAVAIGALRIGGNVSNVHVLAGYTLGGGALNGDAGIGTIVIHGSFAASDIVAGIADSTSDGFGRNDTVIPGGQKTIVATILSLTIRGIATGSAASDDFFGITAQAITAANIHGIALALTTGKDNRLLDTVDRNLRLIEV